MTQIPGEEVAAAAAVAAATGAAAAAATAVAAVPTRRQRPSPVYSAMARARTAMIREVSAVRRHPAICSSTYCSGPGALRIDVTCPEMDVGGTASSPHTNRASVHATGSGEGSSGNWGWGTTGQSDTAPAIDAVTHRGPRPRGGCNSGGSSSSSRWPRRSRCSRIADRICW